MKACHDIWEINPDRLRSLWEMLEFDAHRFVGFMNSIYGVRNMAGHPEPESKRMQDADRELAISLLTDGMDQLSQMGLSTTCKAADDLLESVRSYGPHNDLTGTKIGILLRILRFELDGRAFLQVTDQTLFQNGVAAFGPDVAVKYPSAAFEIDEAGKCLALGRSTAGVFHLMRTMEIGVRAVARCLNINDPVKPAERNWGHVLKAIKDGIDARWPTAASRLGGDGAVFEGLYASLDAVKNPWRNATMHVENKYTPDEATHIWNAVVGFFRTLASRCDENGDPKA